MPQMWRDISRIWAVLVKAEWDRTHSFDEAVDAACWDRAVRIYMGNEPMP